ncbi:LOW QUALITY PROTEIN: uncharacterized protein C1orf100 homolog [Tachyglossus aculeatus]|uniref:LOW QUALITY PROTEIN: uncharacterized protein C1orf100 homolog n=1 Tax=Tachyglossus aculeatus TaxID=9261 RepID=UPI0018F38A90|nr:LOW QUALITY PROTEIN: uncharacterized protein C1orf100 homolog [Tachyglossus aculeatus]
MTSIRLREFISHRPTIPPCFFAHQGKDAQGFIPGQLARIHKASGPDAVPGAVEDLKVQVADARPLGPNFDQLTLQRYLDFLRSTKGSAIEWHPRTTYEEAFSLPFYQIDYSQKVCTALTDPKPLNCCANPSAVREKPPSKEMPFN